MKRNILFVLTAMWCVFTACSTDNASEEEVETLTLTEEEPAPPPRTAIPDPAFENVLIELGIDNEADGSVLTASVVDVVNLIMNEEGISDLSGIEDFRNLEGIWAADNALESVDVSQNRNLLFLFVKNNAITEINVGGLTNLEKIEADDNQLSSLDISTNTALQQLSLRNNELTSIDVSLISGSNQLNFLNIEGNPLTCIQVNAAQLGDIPEQWTKDEADVYSENCD